MNNNFRQASFNDPTHTPRKLQRAENRRVYVAQTRLLYASAVFAAAFLTICLRLFDLTVIQEPADAEFRASANASTINSARANIVDARGTTLATSLATASLYANPREIMDVDDAAEKLSAILPDTTASEIRAKLREEKSFVWIKRNLTPEQHYKVHMLGLPGLSFQREERRIYPMGSLFAHVVGFTDRDNKGIAGIEKYFDTKLRKGEPLQLSMDNRVQSILHDELEAALRAFKARGAAGIVLDVNSGEVLAMVSLPDFDPHLPGASNDDAKFNRNTAGVYEMGSTFKIFNTAMALDSGKVKINDSFDATRPIKVGRHSITDFHPQNRWLSVREVFEHSSNIGSALMAMRAGAAEQKSFLTRLGLMAKPAIELPELAAPIVPQKWGDATTMTVSYGYGISVTPVQLIRAVAGVANGGSLPELTLIKHKKSPQTQSARILSERTSEQMRELLRLAVLSGTGRQADVSGYYVGGKTGTANKNTGSGYMEKKNLSSFVGVFPVQEPKYAVLAMVDEPVANKESHGQTTGGWVAAPAVSRVIARMAPLLGYPPIDHKSDPLAASRMPDRRAAALRQEAVYDPR